MFWKERISHFLLRKLAKSQGFMDPMLIFARLQRFSKPSEVWVPTELLRLGFILQARGAINAQAIQNNLDWVWPFWINRQFDPKDKAFIPRAFSISNINLTYRNWTALGVPDFPEYPLVDPRGLLTPFWDSWSIDGWIMSKDQAALYPSKAHQSMQTIEYDHDIRVTTVSALEEKHLRVSSWVEMDQGIPACKVQFIASASQDACLVICVRPYNPERVSFISEIAKSKTQHGFSVNREKEIHLGQKPDRYVFSNYNLGDISREILMCTENDPHNDMIACPVGMASAAAIYDLKALKPTQVTLSIPLASAALPITTDWADHLNGHCAMKIPNRHFQFLYDIALRTLILHSPGDVYPGPFTYKRFWFRDSAFILYAMIVSGLLKNVEKIINRFPERQKANGYFLSQDGEWDSNGEAIWIMERFLTMTKQDIRPQWVKSVMHGAKWIQKKRVFPKEQAPHTGLMPAGFSAEHLGPNDYYYWDDFWSAAGLRSAGLLLKGQDPVLAQEFKMESMSLLKCIDESLKLTQLRLYTLAVPASPYRRMDGGAIGSLMASYPLQLWDPKDPRMKATTDFILNKCFLDGAFYHEISHSGINVYLSLHTAQVLLRAGDPRFLDIVKTVADLATPTGQWPEAIHPQTKGGCMGDGQHVWAAAEWVLMMRNMFILEEENTNTIILCAGIPDEWLKSKETMHFGTTQTVFGRIAVTIKPAEKIKVSWETAWHGAAPNVEVHLPGYAPKIVNKNEQFVEIPRER